MQPRNMISFVSCQSILRSSKSFTANGRPQSVRRSPCTWKISTRVQDIEETPLHLKQIYQRHGQGYHEFTATEVEEVRRELLSWYQQNRRMLPWRGDPPPWTRTGDVARQKDAAKSAAESAANAGQQRLTAFFGEGSSKAKAGAGQSGKKRGRVSGKPTDSRKYNASNASEDQERIPPSAYGTWVSEIMLQQTRVETVVEYFVKWMRLFPTPKALAEADLEQVNSAWAGLGYYRRAKMLHEGAKKVQELYGGSLPGTAKELKDLPGIGPYTAGAIASIAFGQREPLVDGNVIRVLSRLRAVASDPKNAALNKLCWELAGEIVDPDRPGDFNQALMELGATVCTARTPSCSACPLQSICLARKLTATTVAQVPKRPKTASSGDSPRVYEQSCACSVCEVDESGLAELPSSVTDLPRKAVKTVVKDQLLSVSVVERGGGDKREVLLVKRPDTGLLAGQWECPCILLRDGSEGVACAKASRDGGSSPVVLVPEVERKRGADSFLFSDLGLGRDMVESRQSVGSVVHVFSHLRHTMQVERIRLGDIATNKKNGVSKSSGTKEIRWVDMQSMGGVGITTGMKKVLALAAKARDSVQIF